MTSLLACAFRGKFSYRKIAERNSSVGANIVRQCDKQYDTYYVDILERE